MRFRVGGVNHDDIDEFKQGGQALDCSRGQGRVNSTGDGSDVLDTML